ncbi:hypothetical protein FACS189499_00070 [Clostridia bacterium]|nr:hypothetical protein FACS189499_00070 [Clostridia bacterium]
MIKGVRKRFAASAAELKKPRVLATIGMLTALSVILEVFAPINHEWFKINFAFLPQMAVGLLFGPVAGMVAAIPCDLMGVIATGKTPIPVFTAIAMLENLIYGTVLYKCRVQPGGVRVNSGFFVKIAVSRAAAIFFCNVVINSAVLYYMGFLPQGTHDKGIRTYLSIRVSKNIIEYPVDIFLALAVLVPISLIYRKLGGGTLRNDQNDRNNKNVV